jgi:hypothetical protein
MTEVLRVARGQRFDFPVAPDHPLARHQTLRSPTRHEILQHPFYSAVVARQTELANANPSETLTNAIVDRLIAYLGFGHEIVLNGRNIVVEDGGYMSIAGSWTWLTANEFVVKSGGVVSVTCSDPAIPAFLLLRCNTFGS